MAFHMEEEKYRELQETFPVISLSFAGIKEPDYEIAWDKICEVLRGLYIKFSFLKNSNVNVYGVNTSANTLFSNLL